MAIHEVKTQLEGQPLTERLMRYDSQEIEPIILTIRGKRAVLDMELARIYGVTTKVFNPAVKRNMRKLPLLTAEEYKDLGSQFAISNRSQFVTGSQKHRNPGYVPYAFTEHGAFMAANVLHSDRAIQMSVFVVRAFIRMRQMLTEQRNLSRKLAELEKELTARLDVHETAINEILGQIRRLLSPPPEPASPKRRIGFLVEESRVPYIIKMRRKNYLGYALRSALCGRLVGGRCGWMRFVKKKVIKVNNVPQGLPI